MQRFRWLVQLRNADYEDGKYQIETRQTETIEEAAA